MKKIVIVALLLGFGGLKAYAQDEVLQDTVWRIDGKFGLLFNQVALTNWSAGGQNSLAGSASFGFTANYAKDRWKWDNAILLGYGLSKQGEDPLNKTDDRIILDLGVGYELSGPWYANFNMNFRTQFADGYKLPNDSVVVSSFMAPGYLVTGIGIEFEPNKNFKVFLNPVTAKSVFVLDDLLAANGAYGVDSSSNVKTEFGAYVSLFYKKEVLKNITVTTLYTMFGNYEDLGAWDINWDLIIDFKINEIFSANLTTNLIYDQDINIPIDTTGDGLDDSFGPRTQFRQALGIGLTAKFNKFK